MGSAGLRARPIVHVGPHKTATSWFQTSVYPASTSHRFVDRVLVRRTIVGGGAFDFDAAAARAALGFDEPDRPIAICEEDLSGFLHSGFASTYIAKEVAKRIHDVVPEAQIVLFIRAQHSAAASHYQQYVREGGTASVGRYLFPESYRHLGKSRVFKYPHFRFAQLDYRGLIEHYDRLFGRENVHVYAYEQLAADRDALLERMRIDLGLELFDPPRAGRRVNDAYRRGLLPLARLMNLFTNRSIAAKRVLIHIPYWYPARKHLLRQLNRVPIFGRPPSAETLLGTPTLEWIKGRFWENNRWLAERTGLDLRSLGYPLDPPDHVATRPRRSPLLAWMRN